MQLGTPQTANYLGVSGFIFVTNTSTTPVTGINNAVWTEVTNTWIDPQTNTTGLLGNLLISYFIRSAGRDYLQRIAGELMTAGGVPGFFGRKKRTRRPVGLEISFVYDSSGSMNSYIDFLEDGVTMQNFQLALIAQNVGVSQENRYSGQRWSRSTRLTMASGLTVRPSVPTLRRGRTACEWRDYWQRQRRTRRRRHYLHRCAD